MQQGQEHNGCRCEASHRDGPADLSKPTRRSTPIGDVRSVRHIRRQSEWRTVQLGEDCVGNTSLLLLQVIEHVAQPLNDCRGMSGLEL